MRYIESYKLYEGLNKSKLDDIEEAALTSFSSLIDNNFIVNINKYSSHITITIIKENKSHFFHYDIYDSLTNFVNFIDYDIKYYITRNSTTVDDILNRRFYKKKYQVENGFYNNGCSSSFIRIDFRLSDSIVKIISNR